MRQKKGSVPFAEQSIGLKGTVGKLSYLLIFNGKYIVKVLPFPSSLCTSMRP